VPASSEALDAELRSNELFGFPVLSRTIVVQRNPEGLSSAAQAGTLGRAVAINRGTLPGAERAGGAIPVLNTVSIPPFTRERGTTAITYLYFGLDVGQGEQLDVAARVADRAQRATRPASRASRERWPRARRSRG
jgi:putative drug exporter of the RND superfamily